MGPAAHVINMVKSGADSQGLIAHADTPSDEPQSHVRKSPPSLRSLPLPFNSNRWALLQRGHLSERADKAGETATVDLARGLVTASPQKSDLLD